MNEWIAYIKDEEGISTVEILVIIAVLIAVAILFKAKLSGFVEEYIKDITSDAKGARVNEGKQ